MLLLVAVVVLVVLGRGASYSPSGWIQIGSLALVAAGLIVQRARGAAGGGVVLFLGVVLVRVLWIGSGQGTLHTLPGDSGSRWLGRAIDEQDGSLLGARVLTRAWPLAPGEKEAIVPAMHEAYVAMRHSEGSTPTATLDTLLGRQSGDAFDTIVFEPRDATAPRAAVVFLHGYGGAFTLECWMVAEAARSVGALTVCPSMGFDGAWWTGEGERRVRAALDFVDTRKIGPVFLAGLSNGGAGASLLAGRLANRLAGLILISGVSEDGSTAGLPTLVVHGEQDRVMSRAAARAFADRTGSTYTEFSGGHFVMLVKREAVEEAMSQWLQRAMNARGL